jgi:hypothetical protein
MESQEKLVDSTSAPEPGLGEAISFLNGVEKQLVSTPGKVPLTPEFLNSLRIVRRGAPNVFSRWEGILTGRKQLSEVRKALQDTEPTDDQPSQATRMVRLCDDAQLLRDTGCDRYFFATVKVADHVETYRLDSLDTEEWLRDRYFEETGRAASVHCVKDALGIVKGRAHREALEVPVFLRCGRHDTSGDVYIDLGRRDWKIVRIKADGSGYEVIDYAVCPIQFRRSQVMEELPLPEAGGTVLHIYTFLNVSSGWRLLDLAALTQPIVGNGPLVISAYRGGKGDGKTTTTRLRVSLVDPSAAMAAMAPRGMDGLIALARDSYFVSLDNLSNLSQETSDALCGLSTGTGIVTRQLYTEFSLTAFKASALRVHLRRASRPS